MTIVQIISLIVAVASIQCSSASRHRHEQQQLQQHRPCPHCPTSDTLLQHSFTKQSNSLDIQKQQMQGLSLPPHQKHQLQQLQLQLMQHNHNTVTRPTANVFNLHSAAQQRLLRGVDSLQAAQQLRIPVYGNWCGPDYGSGQPVDAIDMCCKQHDDCYDNTAYNRCSCDRDIVTCVERLSFRSSDLIRRSMKAAIRMYFSATACRCPNSQWTMPVQDSTC